MRCTLSFIIDTIQRERFQATKIHKSWNITLFCLCRNGFCVFEIHSIWIKMCRICTITDWEGGGRATNRFWEEWWNGLLNIKCLQHLMRKRNVGRSTAHKYIWNFNASSALWSGAPLELSCSVNKLRRVSGKNHVDHKYRLQDSVISSALWFVSCTPVAKIKYGEYFCDFEHKRRWRWNDVWRIRLLQLTILWWANSRNC